MTFCFLKPALYTCLSESLGPLVGAQTHWGEEGLAEGDGSGVRLQAIPLRAGRRKSHAAERGGQPSHRHEVGLSAGSPLTCCRPPKI